MCLSDPPHLWSDIRERERERERERRERERERERGELYGVPDLRLQLAVWKATHPLDRSVDRHGHLLIRHNDLSD